MDFGTVVSRRGSAVLSVLSVEVVLDDFSSSVCYLDRG